MTEQIQILDFQTIERASEKYENIREIKVGMEVDGDINHFIVEIYKHFSPVSIKNCVIELVEKMDMVKGRNRDAMDGLLVPYMIFLAIKHFTTLTLPNSFAQQLKAIEHMTNTGVMLQIFSAFDGEELDKLNEEVSYAVKNFDKNLPEIEKLKEQIKEKLEDKTLLE